MLAEQLSEQGRLDISKNQDPQSQEHRSEYGSLMQHSSTHSLNDSASRPYGSCSNLLQQASDNEFHLGHNGEGGEDIHGDVDDDDDEEGISSSEEEETDDDDSELSFDDSSDEEAALIMNKRKRKRKKSLQCEALDPVLQPILKLYRLLKDAIILITNVDDVWDSPAYDNSRMVRCESMRSTHSVSSGSTMQYRQNLTRQRNADVNTHHYHIADVPSLSGREKTVSLRHKIGVLFWFLVLASFYALERCSFKILTDRMGPFRMVVGGEIVLAMHALIIASWKSLRWLCKSKPAKNAGISAMLPWPDVGLMAILDSIQLLLVVISGSHTAPVVTAIVVHVTIPLTAIFHRFTKHGFWGTATTATSPQALSQQSQEQHQTPPSQEEEEAEKQSSQMSFAATLIMLSSILAISPAVLTLINPALFSSSDVMADRTAWNTLLFFFSYIPGALSQVYKDNTLEAYAQPVDPDLLNMNLSLFSAIFSFLIFPILYPLQGLADIPSSPQDESTLKVETWINQYPTRQSSSNFSDGFKCFTGTLDDSIQRRGYPEEAHCDYAYVIVLLHVFSIIVISHAVGKICNAGAFKIMYKGISAGIITSVVALFFYQVFVDNVDYGVIPNMFQITCAAVLVMGSEVYHRVTLETPSFETKYPDIPRLYDDE